MHNIFSYFISRPSDEKETVAVRSAYISWFVENFPMWEFEGEELIMYKMMQYSSKLQTPIREKYLKVFLDSNIRELVLVDKIRVEGTLEFTNMDDLSQVSTLLTITKEVMLSVYLDLLNETGDIEEFIAEADRFIAERLDERTIVLSQRANEMRSSAVAGKVGVKSSAEFLREGLYDLLEIYDKEKLEELDTVSVDEEKELEFLTDSGLPAVDKDTFGLHRTQLFGIEAGAGKGKTRFAVGVWAYRAAVVHNRNVVYYALEQSKLEIEALFIARHIYNMFRIKVSATLIQFNKVPLDLKNKVKAARHDLFESGRYGKIHIHAQGKRSFSLYYETFTQKMASHSKLNGPYDVIVIDYMGLIEQAPAVKGEYRRNLDDYQIIQKSYKKFKRYLLSCGAAGIAVNQFNQSGSDKSDKDMDIEAGDVQGGMEAYRSSDYNMALTVSKVMEAKKLRRLQTPKKRNSEGIGRILLKTSLDCCLWQQTEDTTL
jgi:hypothetical protein